MVMVVRAYNRRFSTLFIGGAVLIGAMTLAAQPALSQTTNTDVNNPGAAFTESEQSNDAFSGPGGVSPLQLFNQINLSNDRSQAEFLEDRRSQFGTLADDFRTRQQEAIQQQQQQQQETSPSPSPDAATP
jgi:hypothetical protein